MSNATAAAPASATKAPARTTAAPAPSSAPAPAAPPPSPTLIVLTLRPNGEQFTGNRITLAQEAGFDWLKGVHAVGWQSPDTGREVARFVVNGYNEAVGDLKEIQFHIDPANCEFIWGVGTLLVEKLQTYAALVDAHLADGMGSPLNKDALAAVAHHIDAVMALRDAAEREAHTEILPSGERRVNSADFSFMHEVTREAEANRDSYRRVFFDAEPMPYYAGRATGMVMAGELVSYFRTHQRPSSQIFESIIREALERCESRFGSSEKDQVANVVSGFLEIIETLVAIGSRQLNPEWLSYHIEHNLALHRRHVEEQAAKKSAMVERLRKGREAAKAQRLSQGKAGAA